MSRHSKSEESPASLIYGINAVREAIRTRPIDHVSIREGQHGPRLGEILRECHSAQIPVRFVPRTALDRLAGTSNHQDVVAVAAAKRYDSLESLLESPQPLLLMLDGVEDPSNLGAVLRSVVAAGASGVVMAERRAAGLSAAAAKSSAGAVEHARIARVKNLVRSMLDLKERGIWVYGFEPRAERAYWELDYKIPCALVLGGEERGLHRLVREACDQLAAIPISPAVESLNVSVAAGIVLYEALRQRRAADPHRGHSIPSSNLDNPSTA